MKKLLLTVMAFIATVGLIRATENLPLKQSGPMSVGGPISNEQGLTRNTTYTLDLAAYNGDRASAVTTYSTYTFSPSTFGDGSESSGSLTVVTNTALSSASATSNLTVKSNSGLSGLIVFAGASQLVNGVDWTTGATSTNTAASLAAALGRILPTWGFSAGGSSSSGAVVYATAPYGASFNGFQFGSSNPSLVTAPVSVAATHSFAQISIVGNGLATNLQIGPVLFIGSSTFVAGTNVVYYATSTTNAQTSVNLSSAINNYVTGGSPVLASVSTNSAIVFTTSTRVGYDVNFYLASSTSSFTFSNSAGTGMSSTTMLGGATTSYSSLSGGQDPASVTIGTVTLRAGRDFQVGSSTNATAVNLSGAINRFSASTLVISTAPNNQSTGIIFATSTVTGARANIPLASSTPTALSLSGAFMTGGANSSYTLNSGSISAANHGYSAGLQLLYTGSPAIGNLTFGATYYAIPLDANTLALAVTSTGAFAGSFITFTSSSTQFSADTYTLAPLAIGGTPGFKWQASNDDINFFDLSVSSINISTTGAGVSSQGLDFGFTTYRFLRLKATAPTSGGILLQSNVNLRQNGGLK